MIERNEYMEGLQKFCLVLTIIGAINWGLIGLFDFNLVTWLFKDSIITKIIYGIFSNSCIINTSFTF